MQAARIAELLQPFLKDAADPRSAMDDALLARISTYIDILMRWNARINLTAVRDEDEIVTRHFGESFFAARHLFPKRSQARSFRGAGLTVADLGSGAGFPGIPIKLWAPEISMTLIESTHKKAAFLREVVRALTLTDIDIQNARAEDLSPTFQLVTLRAVEHFARVLPVAARLTSAGGRLALLIGSSQVPEAQSILPEFSWQPPITMPTSESRVVLTGTKGI
jgi:16S rRNA (guanine527-N7)-methyltransferase